MARIAQLKGQLVPWAAGQRKPHTWADLLQACDQARPTCWHLLAPTSVPDKLFPWQQQTVRCSLAQGDASGGRAPRSRPTAPAERRWLMTVAMCAFVGVWPRVLQGKNAAVVWRMSVGGEGERRSKGVIDHLWEARFICENGWDVIHRLNVCDGSETTICSRN